MIEVENVSKSYQVGPSTLSVLSGLSLRVGRGEFIALMGPSGSGKSTLLNLIAGLDRPTSGRVTVGGRSLETLSERELAAFRANHVGIVFQFFNLIPTLSAQENVELPLLLHDLSAAERRRRSDAALRLVQLEGRAGQRPQTLSGGEQQRVAIARAIVSDPSVIVADEPTGDLDARNAAEILNLLRELRRSLEKTVVMVTHDPRAEGYVDRTLHLDKGELRPALLQRGVA
jgi:putative ABC transport system ATP-binding protein